MSIANELITRGWGQGDFEDEAGRVCLAGAARKSTKDNPLLRFWCYQAIGRVLGLRASASCVGIGMWNDDPERTFDEVLRVAKEADELLGETQ